MINPLTIPRLRHQPFVLRQSRSAALRLHMSIWVAASVIVPMSFPFGVASARTPLTDR
jgi:hypothetical protein